MAKSSKGPSADNLDSRLRRHTPMIVWFSVGMVLLVLVLPSALNLPQANPTTISEYAPVPPDDNSAPTGGNLSSLGVASSRGLGSGAGFQAGSRGRKLATKRCVGNPPRQTSDPMSPPCVAYFEGNNGGATAPGVTDNEVIVLVYRDRLAVGDDGPQYIDFGKEETEDDGSFADSWRTWQSYFNERFQTYGRFVHLWYHRASDDHSPAQRRADAADAQAKLNPFAVIALVQENADAYIEDWAHRGKAVFVGTGSSTDQPVGVDESFYRKYPGRIWSFRPSMQEWADQYGEFLCAQIVPHPVSFAGDSSNGQPRRIGLLGRNTPALKNQYDFGRLIRSRIESCGGTVADEQYVAGASQIPVHLASMQRNGVTTIVFTTGFALGYSNAVGQTPWRPEWIILEQDNVAATGVYENQEVFRHARHFTTWPRVAHERDRPCEQAEHETGMSSEFPCVTYPDALMLFTGIQVAGPRLTGLPPIP